MITREIVLKKYGYHFLIDGLKLKNCLFIVGHA